jgi:putative hydrolase of the HAD superfamily
MGVIYEAGDDVAALLVPFLRSRGCVLTDGEILSLYIECSCGARDAGAFWDATGLRREDAESTYLTLHRLMPGIAAFLRWLKERGVPVACLSNDVGEWSAALRSRFGLDGLIPTWIVSSEVRSRKPDKEIYEVLARSVGIPCDLWLFVDDRAPNLDAAKSLGATTVHFGPVRAKGHRYARDFASLRRLVEQLVDTSPSSSRFATRDHADPTARG